MKFKKVEFVVTATDIKRGVRESSDSCPVALAVKRRLHPVDLFVDEEDLSLDDCLPIAVPSSVTRFINRFDKQGRKAVKPLIFSLRVPVQYAD